MEAACMHVSVTYPLHECYECPPHHSRIMCTGLSTLQEWIDECANDISCLFQAPAPQGFLNFINITSLLFCSARISDPRRRKVPIVSQSMREVSICTNGDILGHSVQLILPKSALSSFISLSRCWKHVGSAPLQPLYGYECDHQLITISLAAKIPISKYLAGTSIWVFLGTPRSHQPSRGRLLK